jgi:hypothetical protein
VKAAGIKKEDSMKKSMKTINEKSIYTQEIMKVLKAMQPEEEITYDDLSERVGIRVKSGNNGYSYMSTARRVLERNEKIVFGVIAKVGLKRLSHEDVARTTGAIYLSRKRKLINRNITRIDTVADDYHTLSADAKQKVNFTRTILAFDSETTKQKHIKKIEDKAAHITIGFDSTLALFSK